MHPIRMLAVSGLLTLAIAAPAAADSIAHIAGDSHGQSDPGERPAHRHHLDRPPDAPMTLILMH